jgi:hypothetical protein
MAESVYVPRSTERLPLVNVFTEPNGSVLWPSTVTLKLLRAVGRDKGQEEQGASGIAQGAAIGR